MLDVFQFLRHRASTAFRKSMNRITDAYTEAEEKLSEKDGSGMFTTVQFFLEKYVFRIKIYKFVIFLGRL